MKGKLERGVAKYKISFIFDDTNSEFDIDAFIEVTIRDTGDVGQEITNVQIKEF